MQPAASLGTHQAQRTNRCKRWLRAWAWYHCSSSAQQESSPMSTIEFGLMLQPFPVGFPGIELFEYNRRLIRKLSPGFTTLWVEDHLQLGETATHECLSTLSYFAAEFPQFRVGALVLCQSYRNPALTAKMAANLQALSGGRFILLSRVGILERRQRDRHICYHGETDCAP